MSAGLGRVMAYQRPFRLRVASEGLVTVAPVSVAYALLTLLVSAPWRDPGPGHRLVAACCAWRAPDLPRGDLAPLLGSALILRPSRRPRPIPVQPAAAALTVGARSTPARRTGAEEAA